MRKEIKKLFASKQTAQAYFEAKHSEWNGSVWRHPIAHICLAFVYRREPKIMCTQCYLAICAPVATCIRKIRDRKAKEA